MAPGRSVSRSRLVVLVVEDNARVRQAEAEVLSGCGYDVLTAVSAEEGLRHLIQSRVNLVITDIRLPGHIDGISFAHAVKQRWPDVKVMIAGVDVDQLRSEDMQGIADDTLVKPFRFEVLEERVAKLLGHAAVRD